MAPQREWFDGHNRVGERVLESDITANKSFPAFIQGFRIASPQGKGCTIGNIGIVITSCELTSASCEEGSLALTIQLDITRMSMSDYTQVTELT